MAESMPATAGARSVTASARRNQEWSASLSLVLIDKTLHFLTARGVCIRVSCSIQRRSQAKNLLPAVRRVNDDVKRTLLLRASKG